MPCACFEGADDAPIGRRGFVAGAAAALLAPALPAQPRARPPRPPARDYVIEAAWALVDEGGRPRLLPDASVRVRDAHIVAVTSGRIRGAVPRIDARGLLLLPGLVSTHTHAAAGSATRGIIEGGRSYQRPLELMDRLDDADLDALTAYNLAELLRGGCTTQVEMSLSLAQARSWVRIAERWHVRGFVGAMVPGTPRLFPIWRRRDDQVLRDAEAGTLDEIAAFARFAQSVRGAGEGRITPMVTPHAADTQTPATVRALAALARTLGSGVHLHLHQGAGEVRAVERLWGARPVEWLAGLGLFEGPAIGAHATAATDADWAAFIRHGVAYAHCPSAGGAGASSGTQPWPEALAAGVRTTIGVDTHSNDLLENVKLAVLLGRARARLLAPPGSAPRVPTITDAIDAATRHAADALRRPDLGRIAVGARADLVAVDVSGLLVGSGAPGPEPLHALLYAGGHAVRHVITDGHVQLQDGRLAVDDVSRVVTAGARVARQLWDQLRAEGWFG